MDGTALFFALNLDHFYRHPAQIYLVTFLQAIWVLPLATWITHFWEMIFPIALIGAGVRGYERDREAGTWIVAPRWRRVLSWVCIAGILAGAAWLAGVAALHYYDPAIGPWRITKQQASVLFAAIVSVVPILAIGGYLLLRRRLPAWHRFVVQWLLGKRLWLGVGLVMHLGIDVLMNVGTFVQVMLAVYIAWLSGPEVDAIWHTLMSRPQAPGVGERPRHKNRWQTLLRAPVDRLRFRVPRPAYVVHHNPGEDSVRRAALLRVWDLGDRLRFAADDGLAPRRLCVEVPGIGLRCDADAGRALVSVLPGFWWMYPWCLLPGLSRVCGWLVVRTFR